MDIEKYNSETWADYCAQHDINPNTYTISKHSDLEWTFAGKRSKTLAGLYKALAEDYK